MYDRHGKDLTPREEKDKQTNGEGSVATNETTPGDTTTKAMDKTAKEQKKLYCSSCGIDCTRLRFHYAKNTIVPGNPSATDPKYDLCPNCYVQGRLPGSHQASDFVKLEDVNYTTIPDKTAAWTDSEILLLLEGLEQFDNDWDRIAKHVGTRTRQECVVKFLNLPIEDNYLENESDYNNATLRALSGQMPVTQEDNPILSVVAFLSQTVDRTVAAAAAGKTVEAMRADLHRQIEKGSGGPAADKPKEPVKAEDDAEEMEVDADSAAVVVTSANESGQEVNSAASLGLMVSSMGSAKSGALISHEERGQIALIGGATNAVLAKAELKDSQLIAMEHALEAERKDVERVRQELYIERTSLRTRIEEVERELRAALAVGGEEGLKMVQAAKQAALGQRFGTDGPTEAKVFVGDREAMEF